MSFVLVRNHASSAAGGELGARSQEQNSFTSLLPITVYSSSCIPPDREGGEPRSSRERKGSWQRIRALPGSAEQLCLIKSLASKINGALHNNPAEENSKKSGDE